MTLDQDYFPLALAACAIITTYLLLILITNIFKNRDLKAARFRTLTRINTLGNVNNLRNNRRVLATSSAIDSYGQRIIGDNYSERLKKMLVYSGDWEFENYSSLLRRKVLLPTLALVIIFIILLITNIELLPIPVALLFTAYFIPNAQQLSSKIIGKRYKQQLKTKMGQLGESVDADYFALVKRKVLYSAVSFVLSYLYLVTSARSLVSIVAGIAAVFGGFFLPDLLLQNRILKRKEEIANSLPDALDMLQMCVGAGLSFQAALVKVAESQSGAISEEFSRVISEVQLGRSQSDALAGMAERSQEKGIQKFVTAIQQVSTYGIPVLNVLVEQAKESRAMRRDAARERAQKIPVKILGPIMLFFLPSVLIIVIGPAVVSIINSF